MEGNRIDEAGTTVKSEVVEGAVGGTPPRKPISNRKGRTGDSAIDNSVEQGGQPTNSRRSSYSGVLEVWELLEGIDDIGVNLNDLERHRWIMLNPCLRFPLEVWERVIENLMDSQDILNVFRAYPMLDGLVMKNPYEWLIDQVMPCLTSFHCWPPEVLKCRQVSRRWSRGVDNFLENHPQKRPYDHESQVTGQLWIPEASKAYYRLEERRLDGVPHFTNAYEHTFAYFMEYMRTVDEPNRNPFVGRSLVIDETHFAQGPNGDLDMRRYGWRNGLTSNQSFPENDVLRFLSNYSDHIWYLDIGSNFEENDEKQGVSCSTVVQLISQLRNLKGLRTKLKVTRTGTGLLAQVAVVDDVRALEAHHRTSPSHPPLEWLELYTSFDYGVGEMDSFVQCLVRVFSSTLRKLKFGPYADVGYSEVLPKLTEFTTCWADKDAITYILSELNAPELYRLEVRVDNGFNDLVVGGDIISWLEKFPKLHSFKLNVWNEGMWSEFEEEEERIFEIRELEAGSRIPGSIPSLRSFVIEGEPSEISFNFLRFFPSLEYLKIQARHQPHYFKLMNMYGPIWETLPKLKEMNISWWRGGRAICCYRRTKYDWLKKGGDVQISNPDADLEEALQGFSAMELGIWGD